MIHIDFTHKFFKSRREEWTIRIWRDVKYKHTRKKKLDLNLYVTTGFTAPTVSDLIAGTETTNLEENGNV